jgi:cytochrome c oxidase cbb3-type subunit 3
MRLLLTSLITLALSIGAVNAAQAGVESRKDVKAAKANPMMRGGIAYNAYCVLCHGEKGDGEARATKLYGQVNLVLAVEENTPEHNEKLIRQGGAAVGRSEFMPAWQDELTDEQIEGLMAYLAVIGQPVKRGEVVFKTNCILCHGSKGDGKGRASVLYDPPPANLTLSDKNDAYKKMIITMGGAAMGRSEVMPVWGLQLSEQQIDDVVVYLKTILINQQP